VCGIYFLVFIDTREWPSVLWHCWSGIRKSILPVKNWVIGYWRGYMSWVWCKWFAYGPADATATPSSLASVKSRMVYLSGASLPRLSWKKTVKRIWWWYDYWPEVRISCRREIISDTLNTTSAPISLEYLQSNGDTPISDILMLTLTLKDALNTNPKPNPAYHTSPSIPWPTWILVG